MKAYVPIEEMAWSIQHHAKEAGFDLCGVVPVRDFPELQYFAEWVEEGKAGEMSYLEARNDQGDLKRASIGNVAPWAKSVIVCALNYNSDQSYSTVPASSTQGWISRYAWFKQDESKNTDYHDAILRRLRSLEGQLREHFGENFRSWCYVDTGPIIERIYAKYAGIGWIGKNTCVINENRGSWLFLGVILTSLEVGELAIEPSVPAADRCGSCTRCIDACPTGALTAPYQLDARRCISYLTIEKRGPIPDDLRNGMGRHLFGCDICQDVCPWNGGMRAERRAPVTTNADFTARSELVNPELTWIAEMSRDEFNQTFRGSPIKRAKYEGLRRNAAIAMGNSGDTSFIPLLKYLALDEDAVLAEHARWALEQLTAQNE